MSSLDYKFQNAYKVGIKWLIGSALLSGVSLSGIWAYYGLQNQPPKPISAEVKSVKLGSVEDKISVGGTVELGGQRTIKSPEEGAVDQVLVKVGDRIRQNQELMQLRNPERETILSRKQLEIQKQELLVERNREKVEEAQIALSVAKSQLQKDINDYEEEVASKQKIQALTLAENKIKIERNRQKVKEAEEDLATAEAKLETDKTLLQRGFIAGQEVDQQKQTVRDKQAELRDAQHELEVSILALEKSQSELLEINQGVNQKEVFDAEVELQQAQSDWLQSQRELERFKVEYQEEVLTLQNNLVTSPIDGIVLNVNVKPGDGVKISDNLITLGDPNQELIQLELSTLDAAKVKPNQPARISIIGPDAKPFTGRVQQLDLKASTGDNATQRNSNASEQATVAATVQLDQPTGVLIPGSPVSVEIIIEERKNVVVVSTEMIQRDGDSPYVWLLDSDNKAQKQPVTLGLEGLIDVEVKSGLKSEDQIILPPPETPLEPGTPITKQEITEEEEAKE